MVVAEILLHLLYLFPNITECFFHDVIYMVNTDFVFNLNNVYVEEIYFWSFLEGKVKDSVNLLH